MEAERGRSLNARLWFAVALGVGILAWPVTALGHGDSSSPSAHQARSAEKARAKVGAHSRHLVISPAARKRILATPTVDPMPRMPATGELVALRSRTSRTFLLPDGREDTFLYAGPIDYLSRAGDWMPIQTRLVVSHRAGYAYQDTRNGYRVYFPRDLARDPIVLESGGRTFTLRLQGGRGRPAALGSTITYKDVLTGVNLIYVVTGSGLVQKARLHGTNVPAAIRFGLGVGGKVSARAVGQSVIAGPAGKRPVLLFTPTQETAVAAAKTSASEADTTLPVTVTHAGLAYTVAESTAATTPAGASGSSATAELTSMVTLHPSPDCYIAGSNPTSSFCGSNMIRVGYSASDGFKRRGLLQFDTSVPGSIPVTGIASATLDLYCFAHTTTNSATLTIHAVANSRAWTSAVTWNKYDATHSWTTAGGDLISTDYADRSTNCSTSGFKVWDVKSLVQDWTDGAVTNDGLEVKETSPETTDNFMDFESTDSGTNIPFLSVITDPLNSQFAASPTGWSSASSGTVTLSNVVAATGLTVDHCNMRTSTNGGTTWSSTVTRSVSSNTCTSTSITVAGTTDVQFQVVDSDGNTSSWVPSIPLSGSMIQLDRTAPTAPTLVTGGSLTWMNVASETITASGATDALSGVQQYVYQTSTDGGTTWLPASPPFSTATNAGSGKWTATISAEGETLARFAGVDAAGNLSSWAPASNGAGNTVRINRTSPTAPTSVMGGSLTWHTSAPVVVSASGATASHGAMIAHYDDETSTDGGITWTSPTTATNAGGGTWTASISAQGESLARFRAVDSAGLNSAWAPATNGADNTVRIDTVNPTTPSLSGGSLSWQKADSVTISASGSTDASSGIDHYEYETSTDGGTTWSSAKTATNAGSGTWKAAITAEGITQIRFRVVDVAGNQSSWTSTTVQIDRSPPTAPRVNGGSDAWQSVSSVTVTASHSTDSFGAGFDHYEYEESTDGGDSWSSATTGSSDTASGEGATVVRFRAVDGAGNGSPWTSSNVRIDRTAPATPTVTGGSLSPQDVPSVTISATSTDSGGSGIDHFEWETSSDGGASWSSPTQGASAVITAAGTTLVRFEAIDAAGNTSAWGPTTNGAGNTVDLSHGGGSGTPVSGTITGTPTWTTGGSPYIVTSSVTIASDATLTIQGGVTVKFESGQGMTVEGSVVANGTSGSPVTFTSIEDDASDGNDSSSDGGSTGTPGDWFQVSFPHSSSSGTFSWTTFDYGGGSGGGLGTAPIISATGGSLTFTDSTIQHSAGGGVSIGTNASADLTRTKVTENGGIGVASADSVLTMIDSAVWKSSGYGVDISFSTAPSTRSAISGTSIWANSSAGVHLNLSGVGSGPVPSATGNNIYDNNVDPTGALYPIQAFVGGHTTDPDWSGNYWGPVSVETCGGFKHITYPLLDPTSSSTEPLGPVDNTGELVGSTVCLSDNVPATPPATQQIDTYFKTPPATFGGLLLQELFGCPDCLRQYEQMIHGRTSDPGTAGSYAPDPEIYTGDPVNVATGTLTETNDDVHMNGPGTSFDFIRTYNSRDTTVGLLGVGWSTSYDTSLSFPDGNTVVYKAGDGQESTYTKIPFSSAWRATGIGAKLAKVDDGGGAYHWTLTSPDQRVLSFNESGQLTEIAPRFTAPTTLSYNGSNQLTDVTDAAGRDISLSYNTGGLLASIILPDTRSVSYTYDTSDHLTGVTDLRGNDWTLGYDSNGYLDSIEDPNGHFPMQATYNSIGQATSEENGNGDRTDYVYSTDGVYDVTTVTAPGRGRVVYDFYQNMLASKTDSLGNVTKYSYDASHNVATVTDPRGNTTAYTYDGHGNLVEQDAPSPLNYTQKWTYDSTGDVTSHTDGRGNTTNYDYAGSGDSGYQVGQLETITDPDGNTTTYTYYQPGSAAAEVGLVHTIEDARSKTTTYTYDSDGNVASITSPLGNETTMTYDSDGRMQTRVDPRGNATGGTPSDHTTAWGYNGADQVTSVTDARGNATSYAYDDAGNLQSTRTPDGSTGYGYDDANQLTSTEDPRGHTENRTYEPGGALASLITPNGSKTTYTYDSAGELHTMVTPRGHESGATASDYTWTYGYDADGDQTSAVHPDAGTSTISYDALDRPTEWEDPLTHTTDVIYDGDGNVTRRTQDLGEHWDYTYDGENRVLTANDPRTRETVSTYEPTGQVKSVTTAAGNETTYTYDDDERLSTMVTPRGNASGGTPAAFTWTYGYDHAGNQTSIQDPNGNPATIKAFDADNDLTSVQTPRGNTTSYTYDSMDRLASVVAPGTGSPTTTYQYDENGDLVTRTTPNGGITAWTYDADANALTKTTPVGEWQTSYNADNTPAVVTAPSSGTVTYGYDRMGRTTGINYSGSTPDVSYTYDHAGRMQTMTDGQGEQDYSYDADNRLTSATRGSSGFAYAYTDGLNLTGETYPNGVSIANTYTDDELLHTTGSGGATTTFNYTPDDQLSTTAYPSSVGYTETRGYDADGNLQSLANTNSSGTLSSFTWTLNEDGAPKQIATTRASTTTNEALTYDPRDRLTEACYSTTTCTGASNTISYAYDGDSNITQQARSGSVPNTGTTNYTYNTADQLTQAVSGSGTTSYTYDQNGDLATAGSASSTYNLADQLASTTQASTTTSYSYDGNGNRVESNTTGGADRTFTWDLNGQLPQIASEQTGAGTALRTYLYGPQGAISITTPTQTSYLYRDPLGSITDSSSSTGAAQWRFSYDPYGNAITTTDVGGSSPTEPLRYAGQYLDPELGQYDMRAREYDPASMHFDSQDPLAAALTQPYVGAYAYAEGDPALLVDPSGEGSILGSLKAAIGGGLHRVDIGVNGVGPQLGGTLSSASGGFEKFIESQTLGWCGDVSAGAVLYGTANGCVALVGGHPTVTGTLGFGATTSVTLSAGTGPLVGNATKPCELAKWFSFVGASTDVGGAGGDDVSVGTAPSGKIITENYYHGGPGLAIPLVEAHTGLSYTKVWAPFG